MNENKSETQPETHKSEENQDSTEITADDIEVVGLEDTNIADITPDTPSLEEQLEKAKSDLLYLQADFENYKRKAIKERSDLIKYGSEHMVRDLLNVLDIFNMALNSDVNADNFEQFHQGVVMTSKELESCLERYGVRKMPALGLPFDPSLHEALSSEESREVEAGHVLRVFKDAFKMHERVIRPAQVVVARAVSEDSES